MATLLAAGGTALGATTTVLPSPVGYRPASIQPSPPFREFRGIWVATVKNIDWPSRPGLDSAAQQAELTRLMDRAVQLHCNAIVLQVRPACDALYASTLEPWSEYLSGRMGQAPSPPYDPLAFAVREAQRRGLELHAWFNPYRARHPSAKGPAATSHITRSKPGLVRRYDRLLWLDPGDRAVEDHTVRVILDVVRRYDIDGVHLDDYFYPYPKKDGAGRPIVFPDQASWTLYRQGGGTLDRAGWRRANVNRLILRLSREIKKAKPWVVFGVSPFGIWRSGHPASVRGLSGRDELHADSQLWLREGWVDYLSPQLYWSTTAPQQRFATLLDWWAAQNKAGRHLWPGISLFEPGSEEDRSPTETLRQISAIRQRRAVSGMVLYSARSLVQNRRNMAAILSRRALQHPVLIPPLPWIDDQPPSPPALQVKPGDQQDLIIRWQNSDEDPVKLWVLQTRLNDAWTTKILPGHYRSVRWRKAPFPDVICVSAVDRANNLSRTASMERASPPGS